MTEITKADEHRVMRQRNDTVPLVLMILILAFGTLAIVLILDSHDRGLEKRIDQLEQEQADD